MKKIPKFSKHIYKKKAVKKVPLQREESHLEEKLLVRLKDHYFQAPEFPALHMVVPITLPITLSVKRDFTPFLHRNNFLEIDFAWPDVKIGIEVNGGIDMRGRAGGHTSPDGLRRDYYKVNLAQTEGWILLVFPPEYCTDDNQFTVGLRLLKAAFKMRGVTLK